MRDAREDVWRRSGALVPVLLLAMAGLFAGCVRPPQPGDPLPGLERSERLRFDQGKLVFEREFEPETGLGPLFNSVSCGECHEEPATGGFGDEVEVHATSYLGPGAGSRCDPLPDQGGPVVQQQVTPLLHEALGIDSEPVPSRATATGRRTTPSILGFGLLDSVPDGEILAYADPDDRDHDGISGRANRFTDGRLGRFGRKAFLPDLREFNDGAFLIEQGITSPTQPLEETIGGRAVPPGADPAPDPELSQEDLALASDFVRFLAPPSRAKSGADARRGETLFGTIGCASCHVPSLRTGKSPVHALDHKTVAAYTDLLLHDMGRDLADICLGLATPSEFRTEPLMGLRLRTRFLHDGRASTVEEAIHLHDGEARTSRDRFDGLTDRERRAFLKFLSSL